MKKFMFFLSCIIGIVCVIGASVVKFGLNYNISDVFLIISYFLCLLPIGIYVFVIENK